MKRKYSKEEAWQWMEDNKKIFFYINGDDSNIFVRKRHGISWNINLGNPWVWCMICVIIFVLYIVINLIK